MTPVLNSLWQFEEEEHHLSEMHEYLRALITDDRKIIHGNSELKRLIRMYDFLKYKKAFVISATSELSHLASMKKAVFVNYGI